MGHPDVDGMLQGMTSHQLAEWTAYSAVEPFGEERSDYRVAYALAVIVNLLGGKDGPPVKVQDYMPTIGALMGDDGGEDDTAGETEDAPPKHPNVLWFEQAMGF